EYIEYVRRHGTSTNRWDNVLAGRPASIAFWYRQSPRYLGPIVPIRGIVGDDDPPVDVSGMVNVVLDPRGRLQFLRAVPPQVEDTGASHGGTGPAGAKSPSSPLMAAVLEAAAETSPQGAPLPAASSTATGSADAAKASSARAPPDWAPLFEAAGLD